MTTEQQTRWTIGQTVNTEDAEAMPVGTVIRATRSYHPYDLTKREDGQWWNENEGSFRNTDLSEDYNTLVSLPEVSDSEDSQPEWATVGAVLQNPRDAARDMPVGSVLRERDGIVHTKVDDGHWDQSIGSRRHWHQFSSRSPQDGDFEYTVVQVGPVEPDSEIQVGQRLETAEQVAAVPVGGVIRANPTSSSYRRIERGYVNVDHPSGTLSLDLFSPGVFSVVSLAEVSDPEVPAILTVIRSHDQMRALPIGSVLVHDGSTVVRLTKVAEDEWRSTSTSGDTTSWPIDGYFRVESHGPVSESEFSVGQVLTDNGQFARLPVGTVIVNEEGMRYEMLSGERNRRLDTGYVADNVSRRTHLVRYTIESLPTVEATPEFTVGQTLDRLQIERLPVGAVVRHPGQGENTFNYERTEDGWRTTDASPGYADGVSVSMPQAGILVRLSSESEIEFTVGQSMTGLDMMQRLPVGTVLQYRQGPSRYTVLDGHRLSRENALGPVPMVGRAYSRYSIVSLPGDRWTVGQPLERGVGRDLPVGSIVFQTDMPEARYRRTATGWEGVATGFRYETSIIANSDAYTLESVVVGAPVSESEIEVGTETFEQYVQRFRVAVYGAAQHNSVSLVPLNRGMEELNIPDLPLSVGMHVHYADYEFNSRNLPQGTTALYRDEDGPRWAILGWRGGGWVLLAGRSSRYSLGPMKVLSLPGHETLEWTTRQPTEDDAWRIADFKVRAEEFGRQAKSEERWCGVYERTMQVMGIDA